MHANMQSVSSFVFSRLSVYPCQNTETETIFFPFCYVYKEIRRPQKNTSPLLWDSPLSAFFIALQVSTECDRACGPSQVVGKTTPDCVFTVDSLSKTGTTIQTVVIRRHIELTSRRFSNGAERRRRAWRGASATGSCARCISHERMLTSRDSCPIFRTRAINSCLRCVCKRYAMHASLASHTCKNGAAAAGRTCSATNDSTAAARR